MPQQLSPFLEGKYGWNFGESGWNTGMDENLLKFSFMFDRNVDSIVSSLPSAVNGQAHYLTTDNRIYFAVGSVYYSTPVPKYFIITVRSTGQTHQFNGTSLVQIDTPTQLDTRLDAVELTVSTLGTAAFVSVDSLATQAELDVVSAQANDYTDDEIAKLGIVSVKEFGVVGDGVVDDTSYFQLAVNSSREIYVPTGTYIISSVNIPDDTTIRCAEGVIFKRKNNTDIRQSYWNAGTAMFELGLIGKKLSFYGGPTFDGNKQNQIGRYQEPTGFAIKLQPPTIITPSDVPMSLFVERGKFINGTSGYLALRGDDVNRRYLSRVVLEDCEFYDTLHGIGKDDPLGLTALGYQPDYVTCLDYVHLITNNLRMEFLQACPLGFYAAVGIRGTFFGGDYLTSGQPSIWLYGTTYLKGLGRDARKWDDETNFVYNNGIGAVDMYGNGESLYCEKVEAYSNRNVTIRAKGSIKQFKVSTAVLTDCWRGLQVGPSTTGTCEADVTIGSVISYNGTIPQLEFVGTSTSDRLRAVEVGSFYQLGLPTNPELLSVNINGGVSVRNTSRASLSNLRLVGGSPTCGISLAGNVSVSITDPVVRNTSSSGIQWDGAGNLSVINPLVDTLTGAMISSQNPSTAGQLEVVGGSSSGLVDYCVLNLNPLGICTIVGHSTRTISGLSRGFYTQSGNGKMVLTGNTISSGVTTPVVHSSNGNYSEHQNSWNAYIRYGTATTITQGTARVGDIVYNSQPVAGGNIGWVCTTAGTPGTWKTFGVIAA